MHDAWVVEERDHNSSGGMKAHPKRRYESTTVMEVRALAVNYIATHDVVVMSGTITSMQSKPSS